MSGHGRRSTRGSASSIMLMTLPSSGVAGWGWKERIGPPLVGAERLAARLWHVLFERRHAGDIDQQPIHAGRRGQRGKPIIVMAGRIDRQQRERQPAEPF